MRIKKQGRVWISGVCDAYQSIESKYRLTRLCLEILIDSGWPVTVQTKSPLVLRDIDILRRSASSEVGFTVTTADDRIGKIIEPGAPPIDSRIDALGVLYAEGIRTFVMVAPILPGAEELAGKPKGKVDHVLMDRLNYTYADRVYKAHGMERARSDDFFTKTAVRLKKELNSACIPCQVLF